MRFNEEMKLRSICDLQARMNNRATEIALEMDSLMGENAELKKRIEDLEQELASAEATIAEKDSAMETLEELYTQETAGLKHTLALVKHDRSRLQKAYDTMAKDLKFMSDRLASAMREKSAMEAEIRDMCHVCSHYNNSIGDQACHDCHGGSMWKWRGSGGK